MAKFLDPGHPWFRPLWARILTVAAPAAWAGFEFWGGSVGWGIAFLALAACRWLGLLGEEVARPLGLASNYLAVVAMAALGFGVRLSSLRESGPRVALATVLVNLMMVVLAIGMLALL